VSRSWPSRRVTTPADEFLKDAIPVQADVTDRGRIVVAAELVLGEWGGGTL
jgi:hypothetical protein